MNCPICSDYGYLPVGWSKKLVQVELCRECNPDPTTAMENARKAYPEAMSVKPVGWGWPKERGQGG